MTAYVYAGPQEYVLPHQADPAGGGTLVLTPGASYDFGDRPPPGPAWWWAAAKARRAAAPGAGG